MMVPKRQRLPELRIENVGLSEIWGLTVVQILFEVDLLDHRVQSLEELLLTFLA